MLRRWRSAASHRIVVVLVVSGAVVGLGLLLRSPTIATSGPLIVIAGMKERRRRRDRERSRRLAATFPLMVDRLIQQLRAGRSLTQSCALLASSQPGLSDPAPELRDGPELRQTLRPMIDALKGRRTLAEAAETLAGHQDTSVHLFAVTLQVLAKNGGPAVPALQRLRHTLIGAVHGREQAAAQASQSLTSAATMIISPVLVVFVIGALSREAARLYLFEAVGALCVFVAVALSCIGWWWLGRDVARLERRIG